MVANKIAVENLKRGGRPKGSQNKVSKEAKEMIAKAATKLGGIDRIVAWAKEAPENERAFWTSVFPKLVAVQVNGTGANGEHLVSLNWNVRDT